MSSSNNNDNDSCDHTSQAYIIQLQKDASVYQLYEPRILKLSC